MRVISRGSRRRGVVAVVVVWSRIRSKSRSRSSSSTEYRSILMFVASPG